MGWSGKVCVYELPCDRCPRSVEVYYICCNVKVEQAAHFSHYKSDAEHQWTSLRVLGRVIKYKE